MNNRETKIHTSIFAMSMAIATSAIVGCQSQLADTTRYDQIRTHHSKNANKFFESVLLKEDTIPLNGAFARLWLNRDLPEANRLLFVEQKAIIAHEKAEQMTPEVAGSEHVKWQMRTWNRIYQLFNDQSTFYPGRLDKKAQAMIEEMFWLYVSRMSYFERAGLEHVWGIQGSENHEMMHFSNALLAAQALKDRPEYKDRKLPDGRTLKEHYEAWNNYYKHYCTERAKHGLLIEVFSMYGPSYTLPEMFNMRDFAEDPVLRERMEKLLHLIWADWAVGQINGVRGGGRTRLYQGDPKTPEVQFEWGNRDRWRWMSEYFLGTGPWWDTARGNNTPKGGAWAVYATTGYRLPDVIMDIALDVKGRGEYTYVTRRIAKQKKMDAKKACLAHYKISGSTAPWYAFDCDDPRMLGYDYCTPDYVMGSLLIDPTLPRVDSKGYLKGKDFQEGYPNLTSQNRYHGIVFASDINARVVPQCEGLRNNKTYGQQQAVQHKNVLLVQRHAHAAQTGDMRIIYGGRGMKERLVERDGWLILKEGDAWLGVKGFSRKESNASCGGAWDDDVHYRMSDGDAPVALIAGRARDFADLDAFASYLAGFKGSIEGEWFNLTSGKDCRLSLHLKAGAVPRVNGKPVNLRPRMLFDCPYLQSEHGTGVVTIQKGERKLIIDLRGEE